MFYFLVYFIIRSFVYFENIVFLFLGWFEGNYYIFIMRWKFKIREL